ncbi:hypothetical protein GUJ93_ZPchr0013g34518 [Zizania palustris]|uniref:Uncharacterized protein n=1 Tax=Zizania palustris TaxID=103762 RepID=A0A8J6BTN7_ZIZPA|nr:hypothetical protein GUJ93_ZPchr0013g34518 [Zizania palustris]
MASEPPLSSVPDSSFPLLLSPLSPRRRGGQQVTVAARPAPSRPDLAPPPSDLLLMARLRAVSSSSRCQRPPPPSSTPCRRKSTLLPHPHHAVAQLGCRRTRRR